MNDKQGKALQALAKTLRKKKLKGLRNPSKAEGSTAAVRVTEIPAVPDPRYEGDQQNTVQLRVAAYCRVSTDQKKQLESYEVQCEYYTKTINENPHWTLVEVYADEGITGTNTVHREAFNRLIRDCVEEKIDLILVKSISRFSRNASECQHYTYLLKNLPHPVKILFETEGIDSFDENAEMAIQMHAIIAQGESRARSKNVRWGKIRRYQSGKVKFSTHNLLGYDKDSEGEIMIDEDEAPVIRAIFRIYMSAYSSSEIADTLNRNGIPSPGGKIWSSGSVLSILKNEKYCGDVIGQKTYTKDYISHKVLKNKGKLPKYFIENHHEAIISKADWRRVQAMLADRSHYAGSGRHRSVFGAKRSGLLRGFVPISPNGDDRPIEDYLRVSRNAMHMNSTENEMEDEDHVGEF